ncbi:MAG: hypothetical protein R3C11_11830 [Planctomycetaceae bacterium]
MSRLIDKTTNRTHPGELPELGCLLVRIMLIVGVLGWGFAAAGRAEDKDQAQVTSTEVEELLEQLKAADRSQRKEVESALIGLGPRALPLLPEVDASQPTSLRASLERIRRELQRQKSAASLEESRFSYSGKVMVSQLLTEITRQTENPFAEQPVPEDVLLRELQIDFQNRSYWEVIGKIEKQLGLHYAESGQFELADSETESLIKIHQGPVRFEFLNPTTKKLIGNEQQQLWRIPLRVYFEPRLRPLYLHWKGKDFKAWGVSGEENDSTESIGLDPYNPDASIELAAESDQGGLQTILDFVGPREVEFKSIQLRGSCELILAAGHESVEFDLSSKPTEVIKRVGAARIKLIETSRVDVKQFTEDETLEENMLRITLHVAYSPQVMNAFESHRTWMFSDPIWIERAQKERLSREPLFQTLEQFPGEIVVAYDFALPAGEESGSRLVYRLPTLVTRIPLPLEPVELPVQASGKID